MASNHSYCLCRWFIGENTKDIIELKKCLASEFQMEDLGLLHYFLGIVVARSKNGVFLSQQKYILDLLKEMGMLGCKPAYSPTSKS